MMQKIKQLQEDLEKKQSPESKITLMYNLARQLNLSHPFECKEVLEKLIAYTDSFLSGKINIGLRELISSMNHNIRFFLVNINNRLSNHDQAIELCDNLLLTTIDDKEKAKILNEKATAMIHIGKKDEALIIYEEVISLAQRIGYHYIRISAERGKYFILGSYGRHREVVVGLEKLLQEAEATDELYESVAPILGSLANVYTFVGLWDKALEYLTRAMDFYYARNDVGHSISILGNMASLFGNLEKWDKSIACFEKVIELAEKIQDRLSIARAKVGMVSAYRELYPNDPIKLNEALKLLEITFESNKITQDARLLGTTSYEFACVHRRLGNYELALSYCDATIIHAVVNKDIGLEQSTLMERGHIFSISKHPFHNKEKGLNDLNTALEIARKIGLSSRISLSLKKLAKAYTEAEMYNKAVEYLDEYTTLQMKYDKEISEQRTDILFSLLRMKEKEIIIKNLEIGNRNHEENIRALNQQLSQKTTFLLSQMTSVKKFKSEILSITKQLDKAENILRKVKMKLRESPLMQESWESYLEVFAKVHPNFQSTLLERYPDLTVMETKICILIKAGLKSEEISEILSLSARTIENHRFHLRKKLGLPERANLSSFLLGI